MLEEHLVKIGYHRSPQEAVKSDTARSQEELKALFDSVISNMPDYQEDKRGERLAQQFIDQCGSPQEDDLAILLVGEYHTVAVGSKLSGYYNPFFVMHSTTESTDDFRKRLYENLTLKSFRYPFSNGNKHAIVIGEAHLNDFDLNLPDVDTLKQNGIKTVKFGVENYAIEEASNEQWLTSHAICKRLSDYASLLRENGFTVKFYGLDNKAQPPPTP